MKGMVPVLAAVAVACLVSGTHSCDTDEVNRCVKVFTDKYPEAADSFSPSYNEDQLVALCADFSVASECVEPAIRACDQQVKVIWQVLDNVMEYTCTEESKLVLRNHSDCLESAPFESDIQVCNRSLQATTTRIQTYGGTKEQLCDAMKAFASCTVDSADDKCGPVAAKWYGGLIDAALDPSKELIDCYFTAGSSMLTSCSAVLLAMYSLYVMISGP